MKGVTCFTSRSQSPAAALLTLYITSPSFPTHFHYVYTRHDVTTFTTINERRTQRQQSSRELVLQSDALSSVTWLLAPSDGPLHINIPLNKAERVEARARACVRVCVCVRNACVCACVYVSQCGEQIKIQ